MTAGVKTTAGPAMFTAMHSLHVLVFSDAIAIALVVHLSVAMGSLSYFWG